MRPVSVVAGLCVLAFTTALVAQSGQKPAARGGGPAPQSDPKATEGRQAPNQEYVHAREELQREIAEAKRLQDQLKTDQKAKDREAVKRDNELLKAQREKVKTAQETVKNLQAGRGRGDGRGGRSGDGRGGDGRGTGGGRGGRGRI